MRTSTHNRALNYDFDYPPPEEEAKQLAVKVSKLMNFQDEAPGLQREFTAEEVMPIVSLTRRLRDAHKTSGDSFIDFPDGRQAAYMFNDLMLEAYRDNADAISTMTHALHFLMPGSRNMSPGDREAKMREQISDLFPALNELVQLADKVRKDDEGGTQSKAAPKTKTRQKPGPKPKKK